MNLLLEKWNESVSLYKDRTAIVDYPEGQTESGVSYTYAQVDAYAKRLAYRLRESGVKRGDFVTMEIPNSFAYFAGRFGVLMAGAAYVCLDDKMPEKRLSMIYEDCHPAAIINKAFLSTVKDDGPLLEETDFVQTEDTDPAFVLYTSGSTGTPKGVLHSVASLSADIRRSLTRLDMRSPMIHAAFESVRFAPSVARQAALLTGSTVHIVPENCRMDATKLSAFIDDKGIESIFVSPYLANLLDIRGDSLKYVYVAGSRISNVFSDRYTVCNEYGTSELGFFTSFPIDRPYPNTPIGKPALDTERLYLLDENNHPADEGEICVTGVFSDGYLNKPEQTAAAFVPNPFCDIDGHPRMFRTRDMGKRLENGDILCMGRLDMMVKINGQRVEPGEVERILAAMHGVRECCARGFEKEGNAFLCAWYVADSEIDPKSFREHMTAYLPDYMIPSFFVRLDEIPKTSSGKVDYQALQPPTLDTYRARYVAPANEREKAVCAAFESVLGLEHIGTEDDFVFLGGDSIGAIRLLTLLKDTEGISTADILTLRTPGRIAAITRGKKGRKKALKKFSLESGVPLLTSQLNVYLDQLTNENSTAYNTLSCINLGTDISGEKIRAALQKVILNYPILSARAVQLESGPVLMKGPSPDILEVDGVKDICVSEPFDLHRGPLARFYLYNEKGHAHVAYVIHHLILDGRSSRILGDAIRKAVNGEELEKDTGFIRAAEIDAAIQTPQNRTLCLKSYDRLFGDLEEIPALFKVDNGHAGRYETRLDLDSAGIRHLAAESSVTEATFFHAVFALVYACFAGSDQAVFCVTDNGRDGLTHTDAVGMFVRNIPVRIDIGDVTVQEYLKNTFNNVMTAKKASSVPFYEMKKRYGVDVSVVFNYMSDFAGGLELKAEADEEGSIPGDQFSDLDCYLYKENSGFRLSVLHSAKFSEAWVKSFAETFRLVANGLLIADKLREIEYTDEKTVEWLDSFNRTDTTLRFPDLIAALKHFAKEKPEHIALRHREKSWTYAEVDRMTDIIASKLAENGVGVQDKVAIHVPVSEWMYICSLAVLKLGAVYVPLNTKHPDAYKRKMTEKAGVKTVLCSDATAENTKISGSVLINAEALCRVIPGISAELHLPEYTPDELASILFTSGSTGESKAVALTRGGYANLCDWISRYMDLQEGEAFGMYQTFTFCSHIDPMFGPLFSGAVTDIIPDEIRFDLEELNRYFIRHHVTVMKMGAAVGRQFIRQITHTSLRVLGLGGEKLGRIREKRSYRIEDLYGQTENTVHTTAIAVDRKTSFDNIGYPIFNNRVYVLNRFRKRLPPFAEGRLFASGAGVTRGYIGNDALTKATFIPNPFTDEAGHGTLFDTGDIARVLEDGSLSFIGRKDFQVKVRGNRVELAEVGAAIREMQMIADVTVQAIKNGDDTELAAYVVLREGQEISDTELFEAVTGHILAGKPEYMSPAYVIRMDKIPLNINGKVDRRALPTPDFTLAQAPYAAPVNGIQKQICEAFEKVLGLERAGLDDDFIRLGGDSLDAIRLSGELSGIGVRAYDILNGKTPRAIAADHMGNDILPAGSDAYTPETGAPLSDSQKIMYLDITTSQKQNLYLLRTDFALPDGCTETQVLEVLKQMALRHPVLRSVVTVREGEPWMTVLSARDFTPELASGETEEEIRDFRTKPFDMSRSLARFLLVMDREKGTLRLHCVLHHLISDMFSMAVLEKHFLGILAGKQPETDLSFLKIPGFEQAIRETHDYTDAHDFYAKNLETLDECNVLTDDRYSKGPGEIMIGFRLDSLRLERLIRENGISKGAFFTAAFGYTLSRFVASDRVQFNVAHSGRDRFNAEESIGLFAKGAPILLNCCEATVADYIRKSTEVLYSALKYDFYSAAELRGEYFVNDGILFQFIPKVREYLNTERQYIAPGALQYRHTDGGNMETDLLVYIIETDDGFVLRAGHSAHFSEEKITSLAKCLIRIAREMTEKERLSELTLVDGEELAFLDRFNETDHELEYPDFMDAFCKNVERYPDRFCASCEDTKYTYAEVDRITDRIANLLQAGGVRKGDAIGMLPVRSVWYVIDFILSLKMGTPYVPVDCVLPAPRIHDMFTDASVRAVLVTKETAELAAKATEGMDGVTIIVQDESLLDGVMTAPTFKCPAYGPLDDACLVYTSGTTGKPKGVRINRLGIVNLAHWYRDVFHPTCTDIISMPISIGFVPHLYMTHILLEGGCADITPDYARFDVAKMNEYFTVHGVTHTGMAPPSLAVAFFATQKNETLVANHTGGARIGDFDPHGNQCVTFGGYGTSETSGCSLYTWLDRRMDNDCLGYPSWNNKAYILDNLDRRLPACAIGQICIAGNGVSNGYMNDPEKNRTSFVPNPFSNGSTKYARMYKTGDYGCVMPDGSIFNAGRVDKQVKIRGNRVELPEVEDVIRRAQGVADVTVQPVRVGQLQELCAYVVLKPGVSLADDMLRQMITETVGKTKPAYMIPAFVIRLDRIPLNLNGKLDRKRLPVPDPELLKNQYEEPENDMEKAVCEAFENVLHQGHIGREDDFIRLGGSSLTAMQVLSRLKDSFLKAADILTLRTPKAIAAYMAENRPDGTPLDLVNFADGAPLTSSQLNVCLDQFVNVKKTAYRITSLMTVEEKYTPNDVVKALSKVFEAYPVLSSRIIEVDGELRMFPGQAPLVEIVDDIAGIDLSTEFDLQNGPLARFYIYKREQKLYVLYAVHHAVFDGSSIEALNIVFDQALKGIMPKKDEAFLRAASMDAEMRKEENHAANLAVFDEMFRDVEEYPRLAKIDDGYKSDVDRRIHLDYTKLKAFVAENGITEATFFQAAFSLVFACFSASDKAAFCTMDNGRDGIAGPLSIGMFVRNIPLCIRIRSMSVADFLKYVFNTAMDARKAATLPFYEFKARYGVEASVIFQYLPDFIRDKSEAIQELGITEAEYGKDAVSDDIIADIDFYLFRTGDEFLLHVSHSAKFNNEYVSSMLETFELVAAQLLEKDCVEDISYAAEDKLAYLDSFNRTETKLRFNDVIDAFRHYADTTPNHLALLHKNRTWTYRELDRITDAIALELEKLGAEAQDKIAICVPVSEWYLICSLAVLKIGGIYVPLNTKHPMVYRKAMLERMRDVGFMLCTDETAEEMADPDIRIINVDHLDGNPTDRYTGPAYRKDDVSTILFTSATTGNPKAVMLTRGGYANLCDWFSAYTGMTEKDILGMYQTFTFCSHIDPMFSSLFVGAAVDIIPDEIRFDLNALQQYFIDHNVTVMKMGAAVGRQLVKQMKETTIRVLGLGGEKLGRMKLDRPYRIVDLYGQTENTVHTTASWLDEKSSDDNIGYPIYNNKVYILNQFGKRVPLYAEGRMFVCGEGVSRGYMDNLKLTRKSFIKNRFSDDRDYDVLFDTGDVARYLADGSLSFLGRKDFQVKIRGNRVEPTEVTSCISGMDFVKDVTVQAVKGENGFELAAWIVLKEDCNLTRDEVFDRVVAFVLARKPDYMVPEYVMLLDEIPLNINGKVDVKKLPEPERMVSGAEYIAPRTEMERIILEIVREKMNIREERFGVKENLTRYGLDSLKTVVLLSAFYEKKILLDTKQMLRCPIVEDWAVFAEMAMKKANEHKQDTRRLIPLTVAARKIVAIDQSLAKAEPENTSFNFPMAFRLTGCTVTQVKKAIRDLEEIHPVLKASFRNNGGEIQMLRRSKRSHGIPVRRLTEKPDGAFFLHDLRHFDILSDDVFRTVLYTWEKDIYVFLDIHHAISDGVSHGILLQDLARLVNGEHVSPEIVNAYDLYDQEADKRMNGGDAEDRNYYTKLLDGFTWSKLGETAAASEDTLSNLRHVLDYDKQTVNAVCAANGISTPAFFETALMKTIREMTDNPRVMIGLALNGRTGNALNQTIACLARIVPLVCAFDDPFDFWKTAKEVNRQTTESNIHLFDQQALGIRNQRNFVFNYHAQYQTDVRNLMNEENLTEKMRLIRIPTPEQKFDIPVYTQVVLNKDGNYSFVLDFMKAMYSGETADRFAGILDQIIRDQIG